MAAKRKSRGNGSRQIPEIDSPENVWSLLKQKPKAPYSIQRDYRVLEREKKVTGLLGDERFRTKLETILQGQKDGLTKPRKTNLQKWQTENAASMPNRAARSATAQGGVIMPPVLPIDDLRGVNTSKYTLAERQTRCKLASVYRLVDLFGWSQLIYNSITARIPGKKGIYLVNPFGLLYSEITASRLVSVDAHGSVQDPGSTQLGINKHGYLLHSAIHEAREDIKCVIHIHTNHGVALSCMNCGLLPISEEAVSLGAVSYHVLTSDIQRLQLTNDLGPQNKVLVLRNHGLVAMGSSIEEAFHIAHKLVKACEIQVSLMGLGIANIHQCSESVWGESRLCMGGADGESVFSIDGGIDQKWGPGELEFEALMRMLDDKGYNTGYMYKGMEYLESNNGKCGVWNEKSAAGEDWTFLDQKKIERTEPVIKSKHKEAKQSVPTTRSSTPTASGGSVNPSLSPLAQAELTAVHVAQSTGEAVKRLANEASLGGSQTPHTLSPLEITQHTAKRVANSTGQAVRRLTNDFSKRSLQADSFGEQLIDADLETSSEPSLFGERQTPLSAVPKKLDESKRRSASLRQLNSADIKTSSPYFERIGLSAIHRSLGSLSFTDGLSPLQIVTHTAEQVAGSTGVAVQKLSGSLITSP